jgi:hypothetical protein
VATIDIADAGFGAIADTIGTIAAGNNQLTVDVNSTGWVDGASIIVDGAGAGVGPNNEPRPLVTTVQGVSTSPAGNVLTLALPASVAVTDARVSSENGPIIEAAILTLAEHGGGVVHVGTGTWSFSYTLRLVEGVSIVGDGPASQLYYAGNGIAINWQVLVSIGTSAARIATLRLTGSAQSQIGILLNNIYGAHLDGVTIDTVINKGGFLVCAVGAVGWSPNCADCSITRSRFSVSGDGLRLMGGVYNLSATATGSTQNGGWGVNAG